MIRIAITVAAYRATRFCSVYGGQRRIQVEVAVVVDEERGPNA
jgi:hypothetical protein